MRTKITKWDIADHLKTDNEILDYLNIILEKNDPSLLVSALGDIARAKGMTAIARDTGLGRESLYKALGATGNPSFATVQKVMVALGLKLQVSNM